MALKQIIEEIVIPEGIEVNIERRTIIIKGPKGEISRRLFHPNITITKNENKIVLKSIEKPTKKEKMYSGTFKSHLKNMIAGVTEGYVYKLKICSGHFPMNVSVEGTNIIIKNFFGERFPRKSKIIPSVEVKIEGDTITLEGNNKELVGQTAANLESSTRIKNRDRRRFQDGLFILEKCGVKI